MRCCSLEGSIKIYVTLRLVEIKEGGEDGMEHGGEAGFLRVG